MTDDVIHSNQYYIRQTDRQTNYFNTVSLRLKRISLQESRAKKLLQTIQLQIFMIYHVYKWSYLGQFVAQTIGTW